MLSKELLSYIKELSKRDTKNLTQKSLKTVEEIGELAKKVLPYEGAFATNHRIVNRLQIIEEIADSMLCLLSIGHDLDITNEELESIVLQKATIWQEKQEAELGLSYPLPYEIHISVQTTDIADFKIFCEAINVKPIVIDLQNTAGQDVMREVMTSSKHFGDNTSVMKEVDRIRDALTIHGFKVVREKVETVPWHPAAPRRSNHAPMPKDCYFECHFAVIVDPNSNQDDLTCVARSNRLHKSTNVFKKKTDGSCIVMFTLRHYTGTYEDFLNKVEQAKSDFLSKNFIVEKVITEFSIYDTKVSHDQKWFEVNENLIAIDPICFNKDALTPF